MEEKTTRGKPGWAVPILVCAAFILPGFSSSGLESAMSARMFSGTLFSLSQILLLVVIIGATASYREFGLRPPKPRDLPAAALSLAVLLALGKAFSLAMGALIPGAEPSLAEAAGTMEASNGDLALALLFSLAAGYREELFYRMYLIESLRSRAVPIVATVLAPVALFAAGHAYQGPAGAAQAGVLGLILTAFYLKGFSVHALAWAHASFNFGILVWGGGLAR